MNTDCELIRDLLPLYQEGLASQASRQAVEAHLPGCAACAEQLRLLGQAQPKIPAATLPLGKIRKTLRLRRWVAVLLAASLILALAAAGFAHLSDKRFLSYEKEGKEELRVSQEGDQLVIDLRSPETAFTLSGVPDADQPELMVYELQLYTDRLPRGGLFGSRQPAPPFMRHKVDTGKGEQPFEAGVTPHQYRVDLEPGREFSLYYVKPDEPAVLLLGKDAVPGGSYMNLPRLALAYYQWVMAGAALLLGLLLFLFYKKEKLRRVLKLLLGLPLCYLAGQLMVKGFSTLSYDSLSRDLAWILICGGLLYAAWLLFWYQRRLIRAELA